MRNITSPHTYLVVIATSLFIMTPPISIDLDAFKEFMSLQQAAYKDATSLLFTSLNQRIDDQNKTIFEMRRSLEFSQNELQDMNTKLSKYSEIIEQQEKRLSSNEDKIQSLQNQLAKLEDYSRKKNIRLDGVPESHQETWQQTHVKVEKILREKMDLDIKVDYAHRLKKIEGNYGPRTIIAKLVNDAEKELALRNANKLKGSQIYINEDVSEITMKKRKTLLPRLKQARGEGKVAYFVKDRLVIKERKNIGSAKPPTKSATPTISNSDLPQRLNQSLTTPAAVGHRTRSHERN